MNNDTIKGTAKKIGGSVESAYGKVTGNKATELKGEIKKSVGKAQTSVGKAEDAVK